MKFISFFAQTCRARIHSSQGAKILLPSPGDFSQGHRPVNVSSKIACGVSCNGWLSLIPAIQQPFGPKQFLRGV